MACDIYHAGGRFDKLHFSGKKRVNTTGVHDNQIYTIQKASKFTEEKTNDELEVFH